jgi:hypothetical protein
VSEYLVERRRDSPPEGSLRFTFSYLLARDPSSAG